MFRDKEYEVVQMEEKTENSEMIFNGEVFESVGYYQVSGEKKKKPVDIFDAEGAY